MKKLIAILMFVWMLTLFLRSGIYLGRIHLELKTPYQQYLPNILPCSSSEITKTDEETYVRWYRSFGVLCEK